MDYMRIVNLDIISLEYLVKTIANYYQNQDEPFAEIFLGPNSPLDNEGQKQLKEIMEREE